MGVATSSWNPRYGSLRPVYTHEFLHVLLSSRWNLQNQGDWLQEGLATRYQLRFHPQNNISEIIQDGISAPDLHLPLEKLCNGRRIPTNRYWQAMTVVETLLHADQYKSKMADLVEAFQANGSTALESHMDTVLHSSWKQLTDDWRRPCNRLFTDLRSLGTGVALFEYFVTKLT